MIRKLTAYWRIKKRIQHEEEVLLVMIGSRERAKKSNDKARFAFYSMGVATSEALIEELKKLL